MQVYEYFHVLSDSFIKHFMKRVNIAGKDWNYLFHFTPFVDLCVSIYVKEFDLLYVRLHFIKYLRLLEVFIVRIKIFVCLIIIIIKYLYMHEVM